MEFNGYVEGVSELLPLPDSAHALADLVSLEAQEIFIFSLIAARNPFGLKVDTNG